MTAYLPGTGKEMGTGLPERVTPAGVPLKDHNRRP